MELKNVDVTITEENGVRTFVIKENKPKDYVMGLNVDDVDGDLNVYINGKLVAYLRGDGKFFVMRDKEVSDILNKWRQNGQKIDKSMINFNGGEFNLANGCLRQDINFGYIYDFRDMTPSTGCKSDLVKKWEGTETPIVH